MGARQISVVGVSILVLAAAVAARQQAPPDPQQSFRSRVTVVPVDVRVVDRNGKPVTDLKQEDFTIIEDGVPQKIVHFSFQALTASKAEIVNTPPDFRKPLGETVAPQNRRIFLLVLGSGRQVGPVRGVQAALKFMKERLLPQDQIAILAYNRATDFTTDHKKAIETLERYWEKHESIESKLRHHFSGLAAMHASREIPPHIQKEVDAIFRAPDALTSRSLAATGATDAEQLSIDTRRTREQIERAEAAADRIANNFASPFDQSIVDEAALNDVPFDQYIEKTSDTMADLGRLYGGIRYLRYLDGEKHLVFLSPNGLFLPRLENSNSIAALANDARVSIDIIHTGGMAGGTAPPARLPSGGIAAAQTMLNSAVPSSGAMFVQRSSIGSSVQISSLTGGRTTAFASGDLAFQRLDESTRAQYLLGYSPTNGNWNGAYRRIAVKVNRKDAQVLYRHGYAARQEIKPLTRRDYLSYSRIASAANLTRPIDDLKMQVVKTTVETAPEGLLLSIDMRIDPGAVKFVRQADNYVGRVDALYFCADAKEQLVAENWQTLDFKLTEQNHQKFMREGVGYTIRLPLKGEAKYLKVILYDYGADLVGSAMVQLKK